ncbi:5'-nucleotidase-like protein [Maribacter vaceletii]|uniref:5'-nucleotidase-like protein n=1 Tax=Maribacter vaceletii TaxID=1206816 RepID=A0A495EA52_9FLAO|nr:5'-nucleotidase [Maribacter vaceletii]RKR13393.1 5'-nucleotidase-like protein [Maribacter vaceletii]
MNLKITHFVIFTTFGFIASCSNSTQKLTKIEAKQIPINIDYTEIDSINAYIKPYRNRINNVLDSTLAYASHKISKDDGIYNTSAGNLIADIIQKQANPTFKSRTGKTIDFTLLNHGGIRSIISKGPVTARTAYEVMPFENTIVVVELNGKSVLELIQYLIDTKRAHPISGIQVILNKNNTLKTLKIKGKPFDDSKTYFVATSNYLVSGGDNMGFFKDGLNVFELDYKIRNAMIDYFMKVDTLSPMIDKRFYKIK